MDEDTNVDKLSKMQLATKVANKWKDSNGIGRNDALKMTVDSMKAALKAGDASLLKGRETVHNPSGEVAGGLAGQLGVLGATINAAIDDKLKEFTPESPIDAEEIKALIEARLAEQTVVTVKLPTGKEVKAGRQHRCFPDMALFLGRKRNVWIYGPAGSGKTRGAIEFAKAAGMTYNLVPIHEEMGAGHLLGRKNPIDGQWVPGVIQQTLLEGGLIILDEIDRARPGLPTAMNAVLEQRQLNVDGVMQDLHEDAVIVACGNRLHGADGHYVASRRQDQSFVNRFYTIEWSYDKSFELDLAGNDQSEWTLYVQAVRDKVADLGISSGVITPRQMINGAQDLRDGLKRKTVENGLIWSRFTATDAAKLKAAVKNV